MGRKDLVVLQTHRLIQISRANLFNHLLLSVSCVYAKDSSLSLLFLGGVGAARVS